MDLLIAELLKAFKAVLPEVFYLNNPQKKVVYPYMTFSYTGEPQDWKQQKGYYLDCDVFDNEGKNNQRIEEIIGKLDAFIDNDDSKIMTDDFFIRFDSIRPNNIPTGSDTLQRRYAQIYVRVDWRKR